MSPFLNERDCVGADEGLVRSARDFTPVALLVGDRSLCGVIRRRSSAGGCIALAGDERRGVAYGCPQQHRRLCIRLDFLALGLEYAVISHFCADVVIHGFGSG
jgi:hypothetical protein